MEDKAVKTDRDLVVEQILRAQRELFRAMQAAAEPKWLALDLTMGQLKGLHSLGLEGPMTIGQLAVLLGIGKPAASVLVDRLVDLGLVERSEDAADRRRTFARPTPSGEELITQLRQGGPERLRGWLAQLSDEDLAALVQGLRALAEASSTDRPTLHR